MRTQIALPPEPTPGANRRAERPVGTSRRKHISDLKAINFAGLTSQQQDRIRKGRFSTAMNTYREFYAISYKDIETDTGIGLQLLYDYMNGQNYVKGCPAYRLLSIIVSLDKRSGDAKAGSLLLSRLSEETSLLYDHKVRHTISCSTNARKLPVTFPDIKRTDGIEKNVREAIEPASVGKAVVARMTLAGISRSDLSRASGVGKASLTQYFKAVDPSAIPGYRLMSLILALDVKTMPVLPQDRIVDPSDYGKPIGSETLRVLLNQAAAYMRVPLSYSVTPKRQAVWAKSKSKL